MPASEWGFGTLKVLRRDDDLNYDVIIRCMRSGVNRNGWDYRNVEQYAHTFRGVPVLCAYPGEKIGDGHNMAEKTLPSGETIYDFRGANAEKIVGIISDKDGDVWTETENGETWVYAKAKLWRFYNRQLCDYIAEQDAMEVSCETEVTQSYQDEERKTEVFTEWRALGLTCLGKGVAPAIPGANIKALRDYGETFNTLRLAAASYHPGKPNVMQETEGEAGDRKNNTEKTEVETKMIYLNRKQIEELPEISGWNIVCAAKDDDGVITCGLRSNDWAFATYKMAANESIAVPERVEKIAVMADFGSGMTVDASEMLEPYVNAMTNAVKVSAEAVEAAKQELGDMTARVNAMQNAENKRRVLAAKEAAKATLNAFNANRAEKVAENAIDAVMQDIEAGVYTNAVDKDGMWIGDADIVKSVKSICADAVMAFDAAAAAKNNSVYVWEDKAAKNNSSTGLDDILASIGL